MSQLHLSAYLSPVGFGALAYTRHDQCIALWELSAGRIRIRRYWELERISGYKHHSAPLYTAAALLELLEGLLSTEGLSVAELDSVSGFAPDVVPVPSLELNDLTRGAADLPLHTLSHIYSALAFTPGRFLEVDALALAMDGGPDFDLDRRWSPNMYGAGIVRGGVMTFEAIESPGPLFSSARYLTGLEPGSLMALATACPDRVAMDWKSLIDAVDFASATAKTISLEVVREILAFTECHLSSVRHISDEGRRLSEQELCISLAMKVVQSAAIEIVERNIDRLVQQYQLVPRKTCLALAGGFALNCPTNTHLMRKYDFASFAAPPCPNDGGQALGVGLLAFASNGLLKSKAITVSVYSGTPCGESEIDQILDKYSGQVVSVSDYDEATFADDLCTDVVAWVDGAAELGPRALGHRSLLGDPRSGETKARLNQIKRRQWWRPVAPIVLRDELEVWFEDAFESPFMLHTFRVRPDLVARVPAIAHVDGTARVQTLRRVDDERLFDAISAFRRTSSVPMICNTSLNDKGEPIANSAEDALVFCLRRAVSTIYLKGRRVCLSVDSAVTQGLPPARRWSTPFDDPTGERSKLWSAWHDLGGTAEQLFLRFRYPTLRTVPLTASGMVRLAEAVDVLTERDEGLRAFLSALNARFGPDADKPEQLGSLAAHLNDFG